MFFSKDFFALNLKFAQRIADVTGQTFQRALLEYTHLYLAFGLARDFDEQNPIWQDYLYRLTDEADQAAYTHQIYLRQVLRHPKQEPEHSFGCFSYALWDGNRVRLHFRNATNEPGVLQKQNIPERLSELRGMFQHLKKVAPITSTVVGGSWLYNIESYRRLFPANYLESAQVGLEEWQFISLWGQFLFYDGMVRPHIAKSFLWGIERQRTLDGLKLRFPYQVLRLESSIQDFYVFYGID